MALQPGDALEQAMARADRLIELRDFQQAKALLAEMNASLPEWPGLADKQAEISVRLERIALLEATRQALDAQQWGDALAQVDRLSPDDPAAALLRQEARNGMVQSLRQQANAAEAKADWARAIALLREAQKHDRSNELLAARIADDERMLLWASSLSASFAAWQAVQAQQPPANPVSSPTPDGLREAEDGQDTEYHDEAPGRGRPVAAVLAVGAALVLFATGVVWAASPGGVLDSIIRSPSPTRTAQQPALVLLTTSTATPSLVASATARSQPALASATPVAEPALPLALAAIPTTVESATQTPTIAPSPSATATPTQSATAAPTRTPSVTSTRPPRSTPTSTLQPTITAAATSTAQPTAVPPPPPPPATPEPSNTPVPTPVPPKQPTPTPAF